MDTFKGTPAPWVIRLERGQHGAREIWNGDSEYFVGCAYDCNNNPENAANAALIAQAPAMLEMVLAYRNGHADIVVSRMCTQILDALREGGAL